MSVRPILRDLTHLGVAAETPPSDAKYIILTNSVGLVGVLVSALYLLVNLSLASPMGGPVASAVVYGLPLWLNRRRCYWAATTWMCLGSMGIQLAFVWVFGYASGNHLYFLPLLGAIALIYPPRHRGTATVLVLSALVIFVVIVLLGDRIRPLMQFDSVTAHAYHTLALVIAAAVIAFISYYSHRRTVIAETQVEERTQELALTLRELQATQAQMIAAENQALLGRLAAGLLHEVNTPLGSIRSAANTITVEVARCRSFVAARADRNHPDGEAAVRSMEISSQLCESLEVSTGRLAAVVEGLRRFVALEEADRKLFDLREGIDVALGLLGASLGDRIRVVREYPEALPAVLCSPAKLNRAFLSILQNAVQAIEGNGEIRVTVREREGSIEIELSDNGKGIPAWKMPEIFDLGLTRKAGRMGLRLGLPMSKRSIEEMGGRLALESIEDQGTTVRMMFPAVVG